jgi:chromodomain-helicase-DNA-binding protein 7
LLSAPQAFSDVSDFQRRYGDLKDQEQVSSLHKVLSPYLLRRMKEEVEKGLPPKEETIIEVEMTVRQGVRSIVSCGHAQD